MIKNKNIFNSFLVFLSLHLIIWTLIPSLTNLNLPLDTIEALAWSSNLDWGFNKHPPLSAFSVEVIYQIFGRQDWAYYFLSQIFIIISFFTIYKFSAELFNNNKHALLSVLLLEGIYFYNFTSPEFNVNISQLPFWSLSVYFAWKCFKFEKTKDFVLLGFFFGLGILSKYLFIYLILGVAIFFIYLIILQKKIKFNYFIPIIVAILILIPHIIWLDENNFSTIKYGLQRTGEAKSFLDHLINPVTFLLKQIFILIPFFILSFFLIKIKNFKINFKDKNLIYLLCINFVPILFITATSLLMGAKIRTMWMTPFYLSFGTLMIYIVKANLLKNLKRFFISFAFFFFLSPLTYGVVSLTNDKKRTDFPGKEIARLVQNKWDKNFTNEIKIVIGDEWYAGNLSYHLISRPKWMIELSKTDDINSNNGVIYTGNPKVLKKICPGEFGTIKPVGYCMIGQR